MKTKRSYTVGLNAYSDRLIVLRRTSTLNNEISALKVVPDY